MTPKKSPVDVGQRLAAGRLQRGLAQGVVAERAGLAPSYLSRIESGKIRPTFATVMRIVDALGAELSEIVGPESGSSRRHPCPITDKGQCLLDLIAPKADSEHYTPREIRLLRRFAAWLKRVEPNRVRAIEVLLDDLMRGVKEDAG
jgi:transcriptional regulator with XRE-family HTH domain